MPPTTNRGFLGFDWTGEGVLGLGLGLRVRLGLGLGFNFEVCLDMVGDGEGDGIADLEKKDVIWRCWLTNGDLPLFCRRDGAI